MAARNVVTSGRKLSTRKTKWVCTYCNKSMSEDDKGMQCDSCENWVCLNCTNMPEEMYDMLNKYSKSSKTEKEISSFKWVCKVCEGSLPTLRAMNKTLSSLKNSNEERFDAIELQVKNVENSIGDRVSSEVKSMKDQIMSEISEEIENKFDSRYKEMNNRKAREMNLVLFNVPVSTESDPFERKNADNTFINILYNAIVPANGATSTAETFVAKNVFRLRSGDPSRIPPIKVICDSKSQVKNFLTNSFKIKDLTDVELKKIVVQRDYTQEQRETNKSLREELKLKNEAEGDKYTIRHGNIVEKKATGSHSGTESPSG